MKTLRVWAVIMAVGGLVPVTANAQTVRLKNGNTLHGEVEHINEQKVAVDIPGVGKLIFDQAEIAAIEESPVEPSWQGIPDESGTRSSRERGNSQRQAIKPNPHYAQAKSLYQQRQYEQAEAKAQRALEYALRSKDSKKVQELKAIIRESRAEMAEQNKRKKDTARLAQDEERDAGGSTDTAEAQPRGKPRGEWVDQTKWNSVKASHQMCRGMCDSSCSGHPSEIRDERGNLLTTRDSCVRSCKDRCRAQCVANAPVEQVETREYGWREMAYSQACVEY